MKNIQPNLIRLIRNIARFGLLAFSIIVIIFSAIMGANELGDGIKGIFLNLPNTLPWLGLLILVYVSWKWELIGGILTTLGGIYLIYFFNFAGPNFFLVTFILTLIVTLLGVLFILAHYLSTQIKQN